MSLLARLAKESASQLLQFNCPECKGVTFVFIDPPPKVNQSITILCRECEALWSIYRVMEGEKAHG